MLCAVETLCFRSASSDEDKEEEKEEKIELVVRKIKVEGKLLAYKGPHDPQIE